MVYLRFDSAADFCTDGLGSVRPGAVRSGMARFGLDFDFQEFEEWIIQRWFPVTSFRKSNAK